MKRSRHNRYGVFKSELVKTAQFSPIFELPQLEPVHFTPANALPFEKAYSKATDKNWLHFYTHDHIFECVWNNPKRYLPVFKRIAGVITPDFSIYREMPLAMQIWNTYRNRALAFWLQREGVPIIPNIRWGDERTYASAFEGLPKGGTVAVSTNGLLRNKLDREYFKQGLAVMIETLQPRTVVNYSRMPDDTFGPYRNNGPELIEIPYYAFSARKEAA
ncbi:MAG: hypothetical protein BCS36_04065 [Desulfovibrio sp. MES5]|uniref:DUF4417 domain-containing protein n=1 Tax=Desulfovibrio sp. MES5 TaxID=1899016 RepID=UPI000B9CFA34|nr:DUF4417 domain-containing protein [Desulfovibrio sp. MES5]OXS29950.1 MAG: hypothetical protein BCS36_04065 [Desulfovibrio sp. MES5]